MTTIASKSFRNVIDEGANKRYLVGIETYRNLGNKDPSLIGPYGLQVWFDYYGKILVIYYPRESRFIVEGPNDLVRKRIYIEVEIE